MIQSTLIESERLENPCGFQQCDDSVFRDPTQKSQADHGRYGSVNRLLRFQSYLCYSWFTWNKEIGQVELGLVCGIFQEKWLAFTNKINKTVIGWDLFLFLTSRTPADLSEQCCTQKLLFATICGHLLLKDRKRMRNGRFRHVRTFGCWRRLGVVTKFQKLRMASRSKAPLVLLVVFIVRNLF